MDAVGLTGTDPYIRDGSLPAPPRPIVGTAALRFWRRLAALGAALLAVALCAPAALATSPFAGWAVIVVAGDSHAHSGAPSQAFDNARRDLTKAFIAEGFTPANISQFSAAPPGSVSMVSPQSRHGRKEAAARTTGAGGDSASAPLQARQDIVFAELSRLSLQAPDGCLIYITSHGNPDGVLVGDRLIPPPVLGAAVDRSCKDRPTVAIISACFSGVFLPALDGPNRMVLTAARPDRASFGCGESDHYTYYDDCILESLGHIHDLSALGPSARRCVERKEAETHAEPASEPQTEIGGELKLMLPLLPLPTPPPRQASKAGGVS